MSELAPALGLTATTGRTVSIEDIVQVTNAVTPCLLLEIGRRRQHIQVEFPLNPSVPDASFKFRAGPSHPVHSISNEQLLRLVSVAGEALVGLCYFGDQDSRTHIETELSLSGPSQPRPCRTMPSPETKQ